MKFSALVPAIFFALVSFAAVADASQLVCEVNASFEVEDGAPTPTEAEIEAGNAAIEATFNEAHRGKDDKIMKAARMKRFIFGPAEDDEDEDALEDITPTLRGGVDADKKKKKKTTPPKRKSNRNRNGGKSGYYNRGQFVDFTDIGCNLCPDDDDATTTLMSVFNEQLGRGNPHRRWEDLWCTSLGMIPAFESVVMCTIEVGTCVDKEDFKEDFEDEVATTTN